MTRLEKIRTMSAEELADLLIANGNCNAFCKPEFCKMHTGDGCVFFEETGDAPADDALLEAACREACIRYLNAEIEDNGK